MASKAATGAETTETRDEQVEGLLLDTQSAAEFFAKDASAP